MLLGKVPAAQEQPGGVARQVLSHAQHILHGVLSIAVGRHDDVLIGAVVHKPGHTALERHPFATVGLVADDMAHPVPGNLIKEPLVVLTAAIVHDNDPADASVLQRLYIGGQAVIRLVGGDDHGRAPCAGLCH